MTDQPLKDIRVADFGQIVALPFTTQVLGWLGAEVVLVETQQRLTTRAWPPFAEAVPGVNRSGGFNSVNNGKLGCTLNLRHPKGAELAGRLISVSDVVVENFSTGTMEQFGLDYASARRLRPDVIYLSLSAFGRTGPMKDLAGFHSVVNLFSGLAAITGHPGAHPRILGGIFPDAFSGCYCILALLEALYHRSKTGEGQYIDVAMTEAVVTLLPEAVMDYTLNGREAERVGNQDRTKAPHDVYRCRGEEKWVAISVEGDAEWAVLGAVLGYSGLARDARFATADARSKNREALNAIIESWTLKRDPWEVTEALQAAGVAASPVLDSAEVLQDPHLNEREFVAWSDHPETGRRPMGTVSWKINGERRTEYQPSPLLGEHNRHVFCRLLGLPEEELEELIETGVVQ